MDDGGHEPILIFRCKGICYSVSESWSYPIYGPPWTFDPSLGKYFICIQIAFTSISLISIDLSSFTFCFVVDFIVLIYLLEFSSHMM